MWINLVSNERGAFAALLSEGGIFTSGVFQGQIPVRNLQQLRSRKRRNVTKFLLLYYEIEHFISPSKSFLKKIYVRNILLSFSENRNFALKNGHGTFRLRRSTCGVARQRRAY